MSLRALKKQQQTPQNSYPATRNSLYKKSSHQQQQRRNIPDKQQQQRNGVSSTVLAVRLATDLSQQAQLLGRAYHSNPELRRIERKVNHLRTKSENDISLLLQSDTTHARELVGAKSEVCLQTISSHDYHEEVNEKHSSSSSGQKLDPTANSAKMISGARSHRDLSHSTYGTRTKSVSPIQSRRLSESSLNSTYSQRTSVMSSSSYGESGTQSISVGIRGYEVIEERARFTVYKLRVENPLTNDCWLVLRRYTDFVRLNNKLKQAFPHITLMLPRKKIFGDNFNSVFLDNRVQGLQIFVNSVMAKEELRKFKLVREFFCLDEPPSYSESMEECRAIFEAQEETIAHLKMQISNKNDLILNLQQKLRDELMEKEQLKDVIKNLTSKPSENSDLTTSNVNAEHTKGD